PEGNGAVLFRLVRVCRLRAFSSNAQERTMQAALLMGPVGQSYATLLDLGSLDSHCHPRSRWHHHHRCCCRFHQEAATDRRCYPCGPEIPSLPCTATLAPYCGMDISWPRSRSLAGPGSAEAGWLSY